MVSIAGNSWTLRLSTFAVWAAAAASLAYWGLMLGSPAPSTAPIASPSRQPAPPDPVALARLMGFAATATPSVAGPSLASRFSLVGVVADRSRQGAALIAVDGRPPKPFRVGSAVDEGLVLQSVQSRQAVLAASADGPAVLTLELPALPR